MNDTLALRLKALGLLAVSAVLVFAFADQLLNSDLACPLCILQRVGFVLAGFGLALNLKFGQRASHYAVVVLGAAAGLTVAVRQVLLHIVPGSGSYGEPFLGLHFYTWAAILFFVMIVGAALLTLFEQGFRTAGRERPLEGPRDRLALTALILFTVLVAANGISTLLESGGGLCPDNPTGYELLSFQADV